MKKSAMESFTVDKELFTDAGDSFGTETVTTVPADFFDAFFFGETQAPAAALVEAVRAFRATVVGV